MLLYRTMPVAPQLLVAPWTHFVRRDNLHNALYTALCRWGYRPNVLFQSMEFPLLRMGVRLESRVGDEHIKRVVQTVYNVTNGFMLCRVQRSPGAAVWQSWDEEGQKWVNDQYWDYPFEDWISSVKAFEERVFNPFIEGMCPRHVPFDNLVELLY